TGQLEKLMSFKNRDKKTELPSMRIRQSGFSMVELMIVCVVMVIIAGLAVPNIFQAYRNYQLDSAGHSLASLLQQARIQAVKTNLPAYVNYTNLAAGNMAFATNNPANTTYAYTAGQPDVQLSPAVTFENGPPDPNTPPEHTQLNAYLSAGPGATPQIGGSIGFNARGLPCSETTPGGNPAVCNLPLGTSGYIWFMQNNIGWEAVTVTPSGRIKSWRLVNQTSVPFSWQ
ncbi:MAG TPA: prepilin-type N-terminal cleavage/methylation domain-containing protein, partial [Candidatus Limnocylindrales bacterium]|nr:prepilin-type N-terminal cleavage/methylation domain-containing protein [Candidatus Limnocylindrales bacterium]